MAELEVAKHGKNVVHLMAKKEHALSHRLREIAVEIAIIVFAVSMSIWLHGLSEHHHQQQEVRSFLVGLKGDLEGDVKALTNISEGKRASTPIMPTSPASIPIRSRTGQSSSKPMPPAMRTGTSCRPRAASTVS